MKILLPAAIVLTIAAPMPVQASEAIAPLVTDQPAEAMEIRIPASLRALDMQRRAQSDHAGERELSGAEARILWEKVITPRPAPKKASATPESMR